MRWYPNTMLASVLFIGMLSAACREQATREPSRTQGPKPPVTIGVVLPLTGNTSEYGQRAKRGIELAAEDLRSSGVDVRIIVEDDEGSSQKGVAAVTKLLDVDGTKFVIGAVSSTVTLSILPVTDRKGALLFSPASSSPKLSGASPLFLRNWPSDVYEASALARYAAERGIERVVILYVNNDYGLGLQDEFTKTFVAPGRAVVATEAYPLDARDFRAVIAKHRAVDGPGVAWYLAGYHKDMALATKQIREGGVNAQILADADYGIPETLEIAGAAAEGALYSSPWYDADANDTARAFARKHRDKFGGEASEFEGNGYDALMLIVNTIKVKGEQPTTVAQHIRTLRGYPGAGGNLTFTAQGDVVKPIALMQVQRGKFTRLAVLSPAEARSGSRK